MTQVICGFGGIDVVSGVVIGGEYRTGQLYYENRPQGKPGLR